MKKYNIWTKRLLGPFVPQYDEPADSIYVVICLMCDFFRYEEILKYKADKITKPENITSASQVFCNW